MCIFSFSNAGDIAFRYIKYLENSSAKRDSDKVESHVTISDINKEMLDVGRNRASENGILASAERVNCSVDWLQADAEKLPLPDNTFSAYTIAFCIRNVTHPQKVVSFLHLASRRVECKWTMKILIRLVLQALEEAYRVLQPGGRFLCLEFSHVENEALRW